MEAPPHHTRNKEPQLVIFLCSMKRNQQETGQCRLDMDGLFAPGPPPPTTRPLADCDTPSPPCAFDPPYIQPTSYLVW